MAGNSNPVATTATVPSNTFSNTLDALLGNVGKVFNAYSSMRDSQLAYQINRAQIAGAAAQPQLEYGAAPLSGNAPEWAKYAVYGVMALAAVGVGFWALKKI